MAATALWSPAFNISAPPAGATVAHFEIDGLAGAARVVAVALPEVGVIVQCYAAARVTPGTCFVRL